jgi:hypothetical protein
LPAARAGGEGAQVPPALVEDGKRDARARGQVIADPEGVATCGDGELIERLHGAARNTLVASTCGCSICIMGIPMGIP